MNNSLLVFKWKTVKKKISSKYLPKAILYEVIKVIRYLNIKYSAES
jgi:hypothetical protein